MGGRGWLSPNKHPGTSDKWEIKETLEANGVKLVGDYYDKINRRNLSLVAEISETIIHLNKEFGKHIDNILIGDPRKAVLATTGLYEVTDKLGNKHAYRNVLIVPDNTLKKGLKKNNKNLMYASNSKVVVPVNIKQAVMHEYGHAIHRQLGRQNMASYNELEKRFNIMMKDPSQRMFMSNYASFKTYKGKVSPKEYVAESFVHLLRGTNPTKGRDMIELARIHLSEVKGVDFWKYAEKYPRAKTKKIKKKRGTSAITSSRSRGR